MWWVTTGRQRVLRVDEVGRSQLMGLVSTVLKLKNCFVER